MVEKLIVGISGKKGSGKDTLAELLSMRGGELLPYPLEYVERLAFADGMKQLAERFFGVPHRISHGTQNDKENFVAPCGKTARHILQTMGQAWTQIDPDCWIRPVIRQIGAYQHNWLVVITDVRFPREADAIREIGGHIVRLDRIPEGVPPDTHPSETAMDDYPHFAFRVPNGVGAFDTRSIVIAGIRSLLNT